MAKVKHSLTKVKHSLYFDEELIVEIKRLAKQNRRSFNNMLENLATKGLASMKTIGQTDKQE